MSEFKQKYGDWALVAGASEGLGAAFARELAARGCNLLLWARRVNLLTELAAELTKTYAIKVDCEQIDLADLEGVKKKLEAIKKPIGLC